MRIPIVFLIALAIATPPDLGAQEANPRQGFWFGVGLGAGIDAVSCDICEGGGDPGLSGYAKFGGTLSQSLLLGVEANGWRHGVENANEYLGAVSMVLYWYPNASGGLYVKGGGGVVGLLVKDDDDSITSTAFGPHVGVGYELRFLPNVSLVPFLNAIVAPSGTLRFNGDEAVDSVGLGLFQAGLGFTFH